MPPSRAAALAALTREVERRLATELPAALTYHDAGHTLDEVVPVAMLLAEAEGLPEDERALLHVAALLHDVGYTRSMQNHEAVGADIAAEMLPRYGYSEQEVAAVGRLILATRVGHQATSVSEGIISDADLDVLGRSDFWHRHRTLQRELAALGIVHDDLAWTRIQQRFLQQHAFRTGSARARGAAGKRANERRVAERIRRLEALAAARAGDRH